LGNAVDFAKFVTEDVFLPLLFNISTFYSVYVEPLSVERGRRLRCKSGMLDESRCSLYV